MVRVTLAQMRRSIPRLVAAGLAIAIGTAFVAATLLAGDVMSRTGRDAVTAQLAQADVVVDGTTEVADASGNTVVTTVVTDETTAAVRASSASSPSAASTKRSSARRRPRSPPSSASIRTPPPRTRKSAKA